MIKSICWLNGNFEMAPKKESEIGEKRDVQHRLKNSLNYN